jgi:hypothetical protein
VAPDRTRRGARPSAAAAAPATPCKSPCRQAGCSSQPSTTRRRGGASAGTSSTCRDRPAGDATYTPFHRRGYKETLRKAAPMAPVERASAVTGASHRRSGRPRRVYVPGVRVAWHDTGACPCARGLPSGARWWPTARCTASGDGRSWLSEPRCRADIAGSLRIQRSPTTRTPGRARCSGQEKLRVLPHSTVQM